MSDSTDEPLSTQLWWLLEDVPEPQPFVVLCVRPERLALALVSGVSLALGIVCGLALSRFVRP